MNIKKIIAREGLILIGVISLGCIIFFISSMFPPYFKSSKPSQTKVFTIEQMDIFEKKGLTAEQLTGLTKGQYPADITAKLDSGEPLTDMDIQRIDEIDSAKAELDRRTDAKRNAIRWGGIKILFVAYILYLIPIRFSLWAVRTLRVK